MHPNPLFRSDDTALLDRLVERHSFASIFLTTPDGPRVAHTPLLPAGVGKWRFHLARGNALTRHLDGARALAVAQGPHGYISPRWYADRATVPTWDYVAVELEGPVRQLSQDELDAFLYDLIDRHEGALPGDAWSPQETPRAVWDALLKGIAGFELTVDITRPTLKLSQKRGAQERATIAAGLKAAGNTELAVAMRDRTA